MLLIALKKRCPRCKQGIFVRIHRKGWMRIFPNTRYYLCRSCGIRFLVLFGRGKSVEKRSHKRYPVRSGLTAFLSSDGLELGQVMELSRTGMSIRYIADRPIPDGPMVVDIVGESRLAVLYQVQAWKMSDWATDEQAPYSNIAVRRCGLRFARFSLKQRAILRMMLMRHGAA